MKTAQYYSEHFLVPHLVNLVDKSQNDISLILRPVSGEGDLSEVRNLLRRDFGLLPDLYRLATTSADIVIAECCGHVVGMAVLMKLKSHDGFPALLSVPWISVDLRSRNCGIATALIRYIKIVGGRAGIYRIDAAKNPCQRTSFLSREGFRVGRKSPAFHEGYFTTWSAAEPQLLVSSRIKYIPLSVMRGEVRIRPATGADKSIWKTLVLQTCDLHVDLDVMQSTFSAELRLVAERVCDEQVLGLVAANVGWVIMLGCEASSRNSGLGSLLLFCAMEWSSRESARNKQCEGSSSYLSLTPLTPRAQRYYEKWGFVEEKGSKKDGYTTMRIEMDGSPVLPQGLRFEDIVSSLSHLARKESHLKSGEAMVD